MGLSIQYNPMLPTVPELLPPLLIYLSNHMCQIFSGACSEVANCHRPCISYHREQLVTYCTSSKLSLSKAFVLFFSLLHPFVLLPTPVSLQVLPFKKKFKKTKQTSISHVSFMLRLRETSIPSILSATKVTTQWFKQPICFCSDIYI